MPRKKARRARGRKGRARASKQKPGAEADPERGPRIMLFGCCDRGGITQAVMKARDGEQASISDADVQKKRLRVWALVGVLGAIAITAAVVNHATGAFGGDTKPASERAKPKSTPVRVASVTRESLTLSARHPGELDAEIAELAAEVNGRLVSVSVDIGDRVKQGDVLARIDVGPAQREVAEARASVKTAEASRKRAAAELKNARVELERGKLLHKEQIISGQQLDEMKSRVEVLEAQIDATDAQHQQARARVSTLTTALRDANLKAPFDGAVAERYLDPGALVAPARTILRLVKSGPLRVRFRVPERDLGRITQGMKIDVVTHATGAKKFPGKVARIGAEVSRTDRTAIVEGVLDAETDVLRPGMYAEVQLELGTLTDTQVVPSAAIVELALKEGAPDTGVFVVDGETARWTPVTVRGKSGDRTAVDGLIPGAKVVTLGQDGLKDGARVHVPDEASTKSEEKRR